MLFEGIDGDPEHLIVTKRPSGEAHLIGHWISAFADDTVDAAVNLFFCFRVIAVAGFWTDDVGELDAFCRERPDHDIRGLLLSIDLATISNGWAIEVIDRVIGRIVQVPEF